MKEFYFKNNELWCENVAVTDAASQFGTPLYIYSKNSITDHCRNIEQSFEGTDHLSCYAVKANANRTILTALAREGIGADVGSVGELHAALEAGFPSDKITFSGVGKRDDEIAFALKKSILSFNVESEEEIAVIDSIAKELTTVARILLRVNFDVDAGTHPYITTGRRHNKFGVDCSKAKEILSRAQSRSAIEILGIHSHIGSQITDPAAFVAAAKQVLNLVNELRDCRIPVSQVNFGGGFGVQYHDFISHPLLPKDNQQTEASLSTVTLLKAALPVLRQTGCKILIQPGRSIVAHAGILVTKVLYRKESGGKIYIIVDAGMNDLIRPSLYQSYHQVVPVILKNGNHETADVVGPLCESGDFFAADRELQRFERNDYMALLCTGAYGFVLSSNYNARPRPAEVMVEGNHTELIRERESVLKL